MVLHIDQFLILYTPAVSLIFGLFFRRVRILVARLTCKGCL